MTNDQLNPKSQAGLRQHEIILECGGKVFRDTALASRGARARLQNKPKRRHAGALHIAIRISG